VALFVQPTEHYVDILLEDWLLLPQGLLCESVRDQSGDGAVILVVGIKDGGFALEPREVLLVPDKLLAACLMAVYFPPLAGSM
jgi:hypothetical protein